MTAFTTLKRTLPGALAVGGVWGLYKLQKGHREIGQITNLLTPLDSSTENRVKDIAKKMGFQGTLNCYETPDPKFSPFALSQYPFGPNSIVVSKTSSDFVIAHELSHLKLRHPLKRRVSKVADPILAICVYNLLRMKRGRIVSGVFGALTYAFSSNFGRALLKRDQEKEADLMACAFLNKKEIAHGVHLLALQAYARRNLELNLLANAIDGTMPKTLLWLDRALSSHPSSSTRMEYIKEVYYSKSNEEDIPIKLKITKYEKDTIRELTPEQSKKLNKLIQNSINENALLGIEVISIPLHSATVQNSVIEHFLQTGEGFERVCDYLNQEFNTSLPFIVTGKYEDILPHLMIERLRERTQDYDLSNCVIKDDDSESFSITFKEKPNMR